MIKLICIRAEECDLDECPHKTPHDSHKSCCIEECDAVGTGAWCVAVEEVIDETG
jgi:hypothetical protein